MTSARLRELATLAAYSHATPRDLKAALEEALANLHKLRFCLMDARGHCRVCLVRLDPHHDYCPLFEGYENA